MKRFILSFCTLHKRLYKLIGFHTPYLPILYVHEHSYAGQKRKGNQVFLLSFDSLIFPFRRLRILLRKTLPAIGLLLAYGRVDVRLCGTALSRFCESKDGLQHTPLAPPEQGRRRKRGAPKKIFTHSLLTMQGKKRRPTAYAVGR